MRDVRQVVSLSLFEKHPLNMLWTLPAEDLTPPGGTNQLLLFGCCSDLTGTEI